MICVAIPSRDRPESVLATCQSFLDTGTIETSRAVVYVDKDQEDHYLSVLSDLNPSVDRLSRGSIARIRSSTTPVTLLVGDRVGPVHSANLIVHHYRGPLRIYGVVPDDARFVNRDWDGFVASILDDGVPGAVAASHNGGEYVNFPFVNREWVEAVGWYFYPHNFHHCCDTVIEILGECAGAIRYASPAEFSMQHDLKACGNLCHYASDAEGFLRWAVGERRDTVKRLKTAIELARLVSR